MRVGRIVSIVVGCLLIIPGIGLLLGGGALGIASFSERDDDGYFDATLELATETAAVTAEDLDFVAEPGSPDWIIDALDVDIRLRVTSQAAGEPVFVGIAQEVDIDRYLAGVPHAEIDEVENRTPTYRVRQGDQAADAPDQQDFWVASASGIGTQELLWEAQSGRWAAVIMNADGTPGVTADVKVGVRSSIVVGLAFALLAAGAILTAAATALIVAGAKSSTSQPPAPGPRPDPTEPVGVATSMPGASNQDHLVGAHAAHPVTLTAHLDPELSRGLWLVKWILAIPHFIVLAFLWIAFAVLTVVAGIAILFTGTYPRGIFDFNVGVLRWSWRVQFYAWSGGIGTDQYPPFSLQPEPTDPAHLTVDYPERLSRPLVLVKWFLAIPHLIIIGLLAGSTTRWPDNSIVDVAGGTGLLGILVLITGAILLITGTYPKQLFDLIVGLNRWIYRVIAYVALMTDDYPPFRLDQGGTEPSPSSSPPPPADPIDLRENIDQPTPAVF